MTAGEEGKNMSEPAPSNPEYPSHPVEHGTNVRFSLSNVEIGSEDRLVHHPSQAQRVITYPTPEGEQLSIRSKLVASGLILGKLVNDEDDDLTQTFAIPESARPLAYDAASHSEGAFSYNDVQLFTELGALFAASTVATQGTAILRGDIRHAIALVEFTRPGERKLFFVPGVERLFVPPEPEIDPIVFYAEELREQFGKQFLKAAPYFRAGYEAARITSTRIE